MNAAPDKPEDAPTRLEKMRQERKDVNYTPDYPECDALYMAHYLWEIGPGVPVGMGLAPIPQSEFAAWQANTGIELSAWEVRTLRNLSAEYLEEAHLAKSPARRAPWAEVPSDEMRVSLPQRIRDALRG